MTTALVHSDDWRRFDYEIDGDKLLVILKRASR